MKTLLTLPRAGMPAIIFILLFAQLQKSFCQDSLFTQDFKKGVPVSSFTATPDNQSAVLSWASASYTSSGASKAGYLLLYSTSTPSLVNSPNGMTPEFAVFNGIIVPTIESNLPALPDTFAKANGLTNGTTYHFLLVAYVWDGIHISSYQYSSPAYVCITIPPDAPDSISLLPAGTFPTSISGTITEPLFKPDGYLVVYSTNDNMPVLINGHVYKEGEIFGMDTVAQANNSVSFSTSNSGYRLHPSTTYHIYVFSYTLSACNNMPVYSNEYSFDSVSALALSPPAMMMFDYFTAAKAKGYNRLSWKAHDSASQLTFDVERSTDSIHFTDIYTVSANNTSEYAQPFNYNDYAGMDAKLYYRIKVADASGRTIYSNIAGVGSESNQVEIIHLEQNPVQGNAALKISSLQNNKLELVIFSIDGRELQHKTVQVQAGENSFNLQTANLAKGMYIIKGISNNGATNIIPFIKK